MNIATTLDKASETESPVLENIRKILPDVAAQSQAGEEQGRVTPDVIGKLREAGMFRMLLPTELGGHELSLAQVCKVIEELSVADGAAGWTAMVQFAAEFSLAIGVPGLVELMLTDDSDLIMRGSLTPGGTAVAGEGGYIVSGRWAFGSGPFDPDWVQVAAIVQENGEPVLKADGTPKLITVVLRGDQVDFIDNWDSVGMRGTDSCDFTIEEQFVPFSQAGDLAAWFAVAPEPCIDLPLFRIPFMAAVGPTHGAVVLGIARGAIEDLCQIAKTKRRVYGPRITVAEDHVFQHKLGELASRLTGLSALNDKVITDLVAMQQQGQPYTQADVVRFSAWTGFIHEGCVAIANDCFALAGSASCYNKYRLQQRWRDVRVAAQHVAGSALFYEPYGAALVGVAR